MLKKTKLRGIVFAIGISMILMPSGAFAAFNDAVFTTDAIISVNGINLNISGSSAAVGSLTISTSTFSFNLLPGSSLQVTSPTRRALTSDAPANNAITNTCTATESVIGFSSISDTLTVTVTPSATACISESSVTYGGSYFLAPSPSSDFLATTTLRSSNSPILTNAASGLNSKDISPYNRSLSIGANGADVVSLQTFLESKGLLRLKGLKKGHFGPLTKKALMKYQKNVGLTPSGIFGAATKIRVENDSSPQTIKPAASLSTSNVYIKNLDFGSSGDDVTSLQTFLHAKGFLLIVGNGHFGPATKKALMDYQVSVGLTPSGKFDPATRNYINTLK